MPIVTLKGGKRIFTQLTERFKTLRGVKLNVKYEIENADETINSIEDLEKRLFTDDGINDLALAGAKGLQVLTLLRFDTTPTPYLEVAPESGGGRSTRALAKQLSAVRATFSVPPVIMSRGKAGFASKKTMDRVKITDAIGGPPEDVDEDTLTAARQAAILQQTEGRPGLSIVGGKITRGPSQSPYIHTWQIAEFGTGIYAKPDPRRIDETGRGTKVTEGSRAGSGAWYLNPSRKHPIILGQRGMHFLFPLRENQQAAREDLVFVRQAIQLEIRKILGLTR